ncbi:MAG: indolepyruvate ferredoxin oxidoreductase subunit alpha [Deltaproteobacteria bacterium]|nr:indolepyruvate ferredoxin oxidoreductase subunit alpha [Deltaproteobacteria bacterium]MBW2067306.1 indolepyruvate ferredoxin oxidoreductase subunit alpha [Deltaproteobacteria bacterium]
MAERKILLGNEAIAYGLIEEGCRIAASYPGTPASEIMGTLVRLKDSESIEWLHVEWSINEKVAFETALAGAYSGLRSAVMMKQVGLNVASDPLMSAAYTGVKGGFTIISADDPGPHSSQTEQDSRFYAMLAKIPVLDPSSPEEAKNMVSTAFATSEKYEIPVMIRPTTRVCHARQDVIVKGYQHVETKSPTFEKNPSRWAATPKFRFLLHKQLNEKLREIASANEISIPGNGSTTCILASGVAWANAKEVMDELNLHDRVHLIKVNMPYPLPDSFLKTVLNAHQKVLVLEETYPVIEYQFRDRQKVSGRLDGTVPSQGELLPEKIEDIIRSWLGIEQAKRPVPEDLPTRRPTLCPGCGHRPVFYAIRKVFPKGIYPGDIGCYTLGINIGAVDTVLCMGASIAQAAGFFHSFNGNDKMPPIVATIGDSTFFHAGIPPLINGVVQGARFVLVILDNRTTAMTGHQPIPPISIENMVRACGVEFVRVADPYDLKSLEEILKEAGKYAFEDKKGIAVVIARKPCRMDRRAQHRFPEIEVFITDECNGCGYCVERFECPAISLPKKKEPAVIDPVLCVRCGVCVDVCPFEAIGVKK